MKGRINADDVELVKHTARLDELVAAYAKVEPTGSGQFKACCPFHSEKTPSFHINTNKGVYHCFGCGVGGDTLSFVMNREGLTYPEAIESLARQYSITLRYEQLSAGQRQRLGKRTILTDILNEATSFFTDQLAKSERAQSYVAGRGLTASTIANYRIGFAPDSWNDLAMHLIAKGFDREAILETGLISEGRQGPIDRFRARIMFPISDKHSDETIAFGGRILPGRLEHLGSKQDEADFREPAKYINSPKTLIYDKSRVLYGLPQARNHFSNAKTILIVEGYLDVVGLSQAGIKQAVAPCGTALTAEHFTALSRFDTEIVLCLDADSAGYEATERARVKAAEADITNLSIVSLPEGKDPADIALESGADVFATLLEQRDTALEFQIKYLLHSADVSTPEGRVQAYELALPLLGQLTKRDLRYQYIVDVVAPATKMPAERIEEALERRYPLAKKNKRAYASQPQQRRGNKSVHLERIVIQGMLLHEEWIPTIFADVDAELFSHPDVQHLVEMYREAGYSFNALIDSITDPAFRTRVYALFSADEIVDNEAGMKQAVLDLKISYINRLRVEIKERLANTTDSQEQFELIQQDTALIKFLNQMVEE